MLSEDRFVNARHAAILFDPYANFETTAKTDAQGSYLSKS